MNATILYALPCALHGATALERARRLRARRSPSGGLDLLALRWPPSALRLPQIPPLRTGGARRRTPPAVRLRLPLELRRLGRRRPPARHPPVNRGRRNTRPRTTSRTSTTSWRGRAASARPSTATATTTPRTASTRATRAGATTESEPRGGLASISRPNNSTGPVRAFRFASASFAHIESALSIFRYIYTYPILWTYATAGA